jgi:hypothetical protein
VFVTGSPTVAEESSYDPQMNLYDPPMKRFRVRAG